MKTLLTLLMLFLAAPAMAAPWTTLEAVELSSRSGTATFAVDETLDRIDNVRFHLVGATLEFSNFRAIPEEGDPIALKTPGILKSGEGSGLVNIPGKGVKLKELKIEYRVLSGEKPSITMRVKPK